MRIWKCPAAVQKPHPWTTKNGIMQTMPVPPHPRGWGTKMPFSPFGPILRVFRGRDVPVVLKNHIFRARPLPGGRFIRLWRGYYFVLLLYFYFKQAILPNPTV